MVLTDLKIIRSLLEKHGLRPTKLRGQNFLISEKVLSQIIEAAELAQDDMVLEIGPGLGILTRELAKRAGFILAIEKDPRFIKVLAEILLNFKNLKVIHGDILQFSSKDSYQEMSRSRHFLVGDYKLVANIPYNITSEILIKFLSEEPKPKLLVLMIQKEVADRILERDGKSSRLSIFVKYHGAPELVAKVPAGAFYPAPKVDSAIIKIKTHSGLYAGSPAKEKEFFELVKLGFSHPRKKLVSNLSKFRFDKMNTKIAHPVRSRPAEGTATAASGRPASNGVKTKFTQEKLHQAFVQSNLNLNVRAENLGLEQWQNLFGNLTQSPPQ